MNVTQQGIVILLKSAVTGEKLKLPEGFSLENACRIMYKQSALPLAYQGILNCGISKNEPLMQKLLMLYYQHILRSERQMMAAERVFRAFEENGIDYMPLKGCNMKRLYPKPEMRVMGDADILIRMEQFENLPPIMESLGFTLKSETDHTANWVSDDLYVELHKSVVPPEDEDYYAYYGTGWRIAVKGEGHRYDPTPEDTFIFLFTHFARHYRISGIGCRHVMDLYVYRRAYPELDEEYIRAELKKLRLLEFYENVLWLLAVWFGGAEADAITELMTAFIFSGGSWGTTAAGLFSQEVRNARKRGQVRHASFHSAIRAVFPPLNTIKNRYMILRKVPWLLPVMWVVRWFDVLLFSPKKFVRKVKILKSVNDEKILSHQQALNAVGLDYDFE